MLYEVITDGNNLTHIAQEIVLGIGGYKVIREAENVKYFHINEAHSLPIAFKMLEDYGIDYVKDHLLFTTHTPVPAGNETQDLNLLKNMGFFGSIDTQTAEKYGGNPFNLTVAALRMCKRANAVSKLVITSYSIHYTKLYDIHYWNFICNPCPHFFRSFRMQF